MAIRSRLPAYKVQGVLALCAAVMSPRNRSTGHRTQQYSSIFARSPMQFAESACFLFFLNHGLLPVLLRVLRLVWPCAMPSFVPVWVRMYL